MIEDDDDVGADGVDEAINWPLGGDGAAVVCDTVRRGIVTCVDCVVNVTAVVVVVVMLHEAPVHGTVLALLGGTTGCRLGGDTYFDGGDLSDRPFSLCLSLSWS